MLRLCSLYLFLLCSISFPHLLISHCRFLHDPIGFIPKQLKTRRVCVIGHILRTDSLNDKVIEGKIEKKNHKRRPYLEFMMQLIEDIQYSIYQELKRKTNSREEWSAATKQPVSC